MTVQLHETRFGGFLYVSFEEKKETNDWGQLQTKHVYSMRREDEEFFGEECDSVTGIIKNTEDTSYLMDWAMNLANKTGRAFAAKDVQINSIKTGVEIHGLIENYIKKGVIAKDNKPFMNWYHYIGKDTDWRASEVYVFDNIYNYGGTIDAISWNPEKECYVVHDFKTKKTSSYNGKPNQVFQKDRCQIAAYSRALRHMISKYYPILEGRIHYIMRDSNKVEVQHVDLGHYEDIFIKSWLLYDALKNDSYKNTKSLVVKGVV